MSRHSHLVVGYDGSKEGDRVIRWAVGEAKLRRVALTVCHAWRFDFPLTQMDPEWVGIVRRIAEHVLDHGVFHARTLAPTLKVNKSLVPGPASSALLHEADDAELIVVGAHGGRHPEGDYRRDDRGGEDEDVGGGRPAGSTAVQTAAMASCPVVVLRRTGPADGRIVVGVDGSEGGDAALAFAFEEAALRGWNVHAVHGCGESRTDGSDPETLGREAGLLLECAVAPWREKYPRVTAWTHLVYEPPREALVNAAAGAEMLAVGDRGMGGFEPLMLGAVSQAMIHHAPCNVTVTHPWRAVEDVRRGAATERKRPLVPRRPPPASRRTFIRDLLSHPR
ncbi:MAG TPA: universal stress protein [Actinomadura sp.]|jgi:nucleotide-binding universal stress UspA family protein|nr:universal stress protein [Actinomadura sp.]